MQPFRDCAPAHFDDRDVFRAARRGSRVVGTIVGPAGPATTGVDPAGPAVDAASSSGAKLTLNHRFPSVSCCG